MSELYRSAHFLVASDEERKIVRRARTDRRFDSIEEVELAYDAVARVCEPFGRRRYALLVDVRLAPARNDPAYEQVITRYYGRLYGGFHRVATLARTEAGRLQIIRVAQRNGSKSRAFLDEGAALDYLTGSSASSRPRT
jgi:hypothetical protein